MIGHHSAMEHEPVTASEDAVGAWGAEEAREYNEYWLGHQLWTFAQQYGADALIERLREEGRRFGFTVQEEWAQ